MSPRNWTDDQIAAAIQATRSSGLHEHPDCIRMAGEWLAAQTRTAKTTYGKGPRPLKHLVESWCKRYVSESDVVIAAQLLGLPSKYPHFAFRTASLVLPRLSRLTGIGQAGAHPNYNDKSDFYKHAERECVATPHLREHPRQVGNRITALQTNC
jgi:hypothetical protein